MSAGVVVYERDDSQLAPEVEAARCETCGREDAEHRLYSGRATKRARLNGKGLKTIYHRDRVRLVCEACLPAGVVKLGPHQYWEPTR